MHAYAPASAGTSPLPPLLLLLLPTTIFAGVPGVAAPAAAAVTAGAAAVTAEVGRPGGDRGAGRVPSALPPAPFPGLAAGASRAADGDGKPASDTLRLDSLSKSSSLPMP